MSPADYPICVEVGIEVVSKATDQIREMGDAMERVTCAAKVATRAVWGYGHAIAMLETDPRKRRRYLRRLGRMPR